MARTKKTWIGLRCMVGKVQKKWIDWVAFYGREVAEEDWPAINAENCFHFNPSPRVLIRKFLRVKISGKLHRMPPHFRCNVVNLSAPNFASVDYNPHLNLNYYFCLRSEALAASDWRMVSGPVLVECRDGSVCGSFSEYHLMNTNVRVKEYRSLELDQLEEEEICVYEVLPR